MLVNQNKMFEKIPKFYLFEFRMPFSAKNFALALLKLSKFNSFDKIMHVYTHRYNLLKLYQTAS